MSSNVERSALMGFLHDNDSQYHAKVLELRDAVEGWLSYIPESFPHYTLHTVDHSDEIVWQVSKLLFKDGDPAQPAVQLSAIEGYILAAAAYLHDSGMVVSDAEKLEILESETWKKWIASGHGARRMEKIAQLRQAQRPDNEAARMFLADLQTRYLIAEFVRRSHHERAARLILGNQSALGRFAFDDPQLLRTISDVCAAHGLRHHELEDRVRYPDRRDLRNETANVMFVAILLRLGDLLDMRTDRACPLLMNAACPLPSDSLAHWTQYKCIRHHLTAPDRIEVHAECQTQEEHRVLEDWCEWIVAETQAAGRLMAGCRRHLGWQPPRAAMEGSSATIAIRPAADATYIWSRWRLELDSQVIFDRLIHDVSSNPAVFVRELIQNALDATRCRMYADMKSVDIQPPACPTHAEEDWRARYPVQVALVQRSLPNALSGETELRQVLIVDDNGIGMDKHVIQHYFLQTGRSYYTSDEFLRAYSFVPTSRFGLGFLSVFRVSDHVTVETYKPDSVDGDGPIRLTLTGPRNYLLTQRGTRRTPGTRIEVVLRDRLRLGQLTKTVSGWCTRVEFPVHVDDLGTKTTIAAERPEQFTCEVPGVAGEGKFLIRSFPVDRPNIEGELYVFAYRNTRGESWASWPWARHTYTEKHPQAVVPDLPGNLVCLHGITISGNSGYISRPFCARLDYRGSDHHPTLSRDDRTSLFRGHTTDAAIASRWVELLRDHLESTVLGADEEGWKYKQSLVDQFPFEQYWYTVPASLRVYLDGKPRFASLSELDENNTIISTASPTRRSWHGLSSRDSTTRPQTAVPHSGGAPVMTSRDLGRVSHAHCAKLFQDRQPTDVIWLSQSEVAITWERVEGVQEALDADRPMAILPLPDRSAIGCAIHRTTDRIYDCLLLNEDHEFVRWLLDAREACSQHASGLQPYQFSRLLSLMINPLARQGYELAKLQAYVEGWRELPGLPTELYPPDIELDERMFRLERPGA